LLNDISLSAFLNLEGVLETGRESADQSELRLLLEAPFNEALDQFEQQRAREGEHTRQNILFHFKKLEKSLETINSNLRLVEETLKNNLLPVLLLLELSFIHQFLMAKYRLRNINWMINK
jgi:uncharacterized protein YicC (UPF0701 family)